MFCKKMFKILHQNRFLHDGKLFYLYLIIKLNTSKEKPIASLISLPVNSCRETMPPKSIKPSSSSHQTQQPTSKESYAMVPITSSPILPKSSALQTTIPRMRPFSSQDWYTQLMEEEHQQQQILSQVTDKSFAQVTTGPSREVATRPSTSSMVALGPMTSSSKQVVVSTDPTPISQISPLKSSYFIKPQTYLITDLQQEIENPFGYPMNHFLINQILHSVFLPDHHFIISNPLKTQKFYEFILVDTDSVSFKHYPDRNDSSQIAYSTCQIHKILTIDDWQTHPNQTRQFSKHFVPLTYNYWDYQSAWYKTFYYQNKMFRHSWMFYFSSKFHQDLPVWFTSWWTTFGPVADILPKPAHQGLQIYQAKFKIPSSYPMNKFPHLFYFFQQFSLAWIFQWEYDHQGQTISSLSRRHKVKWWDQFKIERVTPAAIDKYLHQHPALTTSTSQFLLQKSKNLSKLAASSSKEELRQQLLQALESLSEHDQASSEESNSPAESFSSVNLGNDNEDDCYGILPPIPASSSPNIKKSKNKTKTKK